MSVQNISHLEVKTNKVPSHDDKTKIQCNKGLGKTSSIIPPEESEHFLISEKRARFKLVEEENGPTGSEEQTNQCNHSKLL